MKISRLVYFKGLALGCGATVLWASFYPAGRYLFGEEAESVDAVWFTFLRLLTGAAGFWVWNLRKDKLIRLKKALLADWRLFLWLAVVGVAMENLLVFWSLKFTTAARSSLLANTSPITTAVLAAVFMKEAISRRQGLGMLLGFAGVAGAMLSRGGDMYGAGSGLDFLPGDILALAAGACWSIYTVWGGTVSRRYGSSLSTALLFTLGALLLLPVMIASGSEMTLRLPWRVWLGVLYLGVMTAGVANAMWMAALKMIPPGRLGALGYVSSSLTLLFSVWLLKEKVTTWFVMALIMVVVGVYLMMKMPEKKGRV